MRQHMSDVKISLCQVPLEKNEDNRPVQILLLFATYIVRAGSEVVPIIGQHITLHRLSYQPKNRHYRN